MSKRKNKVIRRYVGPPDILEEDPEELAGPGWVGIRLEQKTDEDAQKALNEVDKSREEGIPEDWIVVDLYGRPANTD